MARQKGITKLEGTIGGLNFYSTEVRDDIAREIPGPTSEQVKTASEFENITHCLLTGYS